MAFWNRKKKKQLNTAMEDASYLDPSLDLEQEFSRRKKGRDDAFDRIESLQYVRAQCDQVVESSRYITQLKTEYQSVGNYLMDVQKIDTAPAGTKNALRGLALDAIRLDGKREKYRKKQSNLPQNRFAIYERHKDDFPEALTNFQNDEKYMQTVKHDMRILEAEKLSIKEDIENCASCRVLMRNLALIFLFLFLAVLVVMFIAGLSGYTNGQIAIMIVLLVAVVVEVGLVILMQSTIYRRQYNEKKLNRAITLLNKTKIKYVNIANSVDYQKAKFKVKNGYQLSHEYELYLMDVKAMERYENSTKELNATLVGISQILRSLELNDVGVWESQLEALADDKEMVEVRHSLNIRRQKLREQIDYNMGRIEEAKKGVLKYIASHPKDAETIMGIVDSYDMDIES